MMSQSYEWVKTSPLSFQFNFQMLQTVTAAGPENQVAWIGVKEDKEFYGNLEFGDLFIRVYSDDGTLIASNNIIGHAQIAALSFDQQGDLILCLLTRTSVTFENGGTLNYEGDYVSNFMVKLDSDLNFMWSKDLTQPAYYSFNMCLAVDAINNVYTGINSGYSTKIIKYAPDGSFLQEVLQDDVHVLSSIDVDNEGNVYGAGSCANDAVFGGVPFPTSLTYNYYIVKYDSLLEAQWVKYIEDITCELPAVACNDPDYVYLAGGLFTSTTLGNIMLNGPEWVYDYFVTRLNADGEFEWALELEPQSMPGDATIGKLQYIDADKQNNLYLAGYQRGTIDWGNGLVTFGISNGYDAIVLKYDPSGSIINANIAGCDGYDLGASVCATGNGNYYLAGTVSNQAAFDTITVNLDGANPFLAKIDGENTTTGISIGDQRPTVKVYPNPVTDILNIENRSSRLVSTTASLYNEFGEILMSRDYIDQLRIDMTTFPSGLYLLNITNTDGTSVVRKFLKQ